MIATKFKFRTRGFTLIELLVVISIIALLLGILLPSLNAAREHGKSAYCLSNLRQMSIASYSYNLNNNNYFTLAQWADEKKSYCWDFVTYSEDGADVVEPGLLWEGDTTAEINQCPSYKGTNNFGNIDTYTGYNYNTSYIGHGQGESTTRKFTGTKKPHPVWPAFYSIVMPAKVTKLSSPGNCALFGDGHFSGGANKFMRSPDTWDGDRSSSLRSAGTQGFRHNQKTNVAWADGHASSESRYHTDSYDRVYNMSLDNIKNQLDSYNENAKVKIGFISNNNKAYDLR